MFKNNEMPEESIMSTLEGVLRFIRNAPEESWSVIFREISSTRKLRNCEAVRHLKIGDLVCFDRHHQLHRSQAVFQRSDVTVE
jgi:hypothetical protein